MSALTPIKKLANGALGIVRGPFFLAAMSVALLLAIVPLMLSNDPAQATLLKGYLQSVQPANQLTSESAAVTSEETPCRAPLLEDSFPTSFSGAWRCVSIVVASEVATVPVGQKVEAEVSFLPSRNGRIAAYWDQTGWSEAQSHVMPISDREVACQRTNYYLGESSTGTWTARSRDHYLQLDGNHISASSSVEQFTSGQYLGSYRTHSVLYRRSGNLALAR